LAQQKIRKAKNAQESAANTWVIEIKLRPHYLEAGSQPVPAVRPGYLVRILKLVYSRVRVIVEISADRDQAVSANDRHLWERRLTGGNADILVLEFTLARKYSRIPGKAHLRLVHEMSGQGRGEFQGGEMVSESGVLGRARCARRI